MSLANVMAEDRRLVILRTLSEATGYKLNESLLKKSLAFFGHGVGQDVVRADVTYLAEHGLVRVEHLPVSSGVLWLVTLSQAGQDVAEGRYHPGVARRGAE